MHYMNDIRVGSPHCGQFDKGGMPIGNCVSRQMIGEHSLLFMCNFIFNIQDQLKRALKRAAKLSWLFQQIV